MTTAWYELDTTRIVWLFSMALGHSRFIFARFVMHQDLQTLLRCHMQAFAAIGGVPIEIVNRRRTLTPDRTAILMQWTTPAPGIGVP